MNSQSETKSDERAEFLYRGKIYVRPVGRGIILEDHPGKPHFDEILDVGTYEVEFRVLRRVPDLE